MAEAVDLVLGILVERFEQLIVSARARCAVPPGPPAVTLAEGIVGAVEGAEIQLADEEPDAARVAELAVLGILGLDPRAYPAP